MDFISVQVINNLIKRNRNENHAPRTLKVHLLTLVCLIGQSINFGTGVGSADNITKLMYRFLMKFCLLESNLPIKTI